MVHYMDAAPRYRAPWHLWVLGGLNTLWCGFGSFDFTMTATQGEAWLRRAGMSEAQIALFNAMPVWATGAWAVGVFAGLVGSLLLLARSRLATPVLALSLLGGIVSQTPSLLSEQARAALGPQVFMGAFIIIWAALMTWYAWTQAKRGVLR